MTNVDIIYLIFVLFDGDCHIERFSSSKRKCSALVLNAPITQLFCVSDNDILVKSRIYVKRNSTLTDQVNCKSAKKLLTIFTFLSHSYRLQSNIIKINIERAFLRTYLSACGLTCPRMIICLPGRRPCGIDASYGVGFN